MVLPKPDFPLGEKGKLLVQKIPAIQQKWRGAVAGSLNIINFGLRNPKVLEPVNFLSRKLLSWQIPDRQLRKNVTPNFSIGCKRLLFANN